MVEFSILRCWDIRYLPHKKAKVTKAKKIPFLRQSSSDGSLAHGARRPRGIVSTCQGSGPTAGLLFALSADSSIHTYDLSSLEPQGPCYTHENLQISTFYIGLSISPCGQWLASGTVTNLKSKGSCLLFDARGAGRGVYDILPGVELTCQEGEVGTVDWADGQLAACSDDGLIRIWRPDAGVYKRCLESPDTMSRNWNWPATR
jgi:denticleless